MSQKEYMVLGDEFMKNISILLIATMALGGCQFLQRNPQIIESIVRIGVKLAMSAVLNNNPDLAPIFLSTSAVFSNTETTDPELIRNDLNGITDNPLVLDATEIILTEYANLYEDKLDNISPNQYLEILQAIGESIRSSADSIINGTVASAPEFVVQAGETMVVID